MHFFYHLTFDIFVAARRTDGCRQMTHLIARHDMAGHLAFVLVASKCLLLLRTDDDDDDIGRLVYRSFAIGKAPSSQMPVNATGGYIRRSIKAYVSMCVCVWCGICVQMSADILDAGHILSNVHIYTRMGIHTCNILSFMKDSILSTVNSFAFPNETVNCDKKRLSFVHLEILLFCQVQVKNDFFLCYVAGGAKNILNERSKYLLVFICRYVNVCTKILRNRDCDANLCVLKCGFGKRFFVF